MGNTTGWAPSVARELGLKNELNYQSYEGGRVTVNLECSTCPKIREVSFAKRFPPDVFKKKLNELGWDVKKKGKHRCPTCVSHGNKGTIKQTVNTENRMAETVKVSRNGTQTSLTINKDDDLFKTFVGEDGRPNAYWSMEYSIDRDGLPLLIVSRQKAPEDGKKRERGKAKGSITTSSGAYLLQVANGATEGVNRVIEFSPTIAELKSQQGRHITFELPRSIKSVERMMPDSFKPTSPTEVQKAIKPKPEPVKKPKTLSVPEPETPVEVAVKEKPAPTPETKPVVQQEPQPAKEAWSSPAKRQQLEPSPFINKHSIGLVYAVKVVNHYKSMMGDDLDLTIDPETGQLNAMASIS